MDINPLRGLWHQAFPLKSSLRCLLSLSLYQTSLRNSVSCSGVGLHSGRQVSLALHPAPEGHGIVFQRTDLSGTPRIPARSDAVGDVFLSTSIANDEGVEIATIEHLCAALYGLGIDHALVEVSAPELPILDGSAKLWCDLIKEAGISEVAPKRNWLKILAPIEVAGEGGAYARLLPNEGGLELDVGIEFADPAIGRQHIEIAITPESFAAELAPARTFGFYRDLEALHSQQRGLGASLENTIAIEEGRVLNPEGLRFADEFVRHKALDALGDLSLAGMPILGRLESFKGGHALTGRLLQQTLATPDARRIETSAPDMAAS